MKFIKYLAFLNLKISALLNTSIITHMWIKNKHTYTWIIFHAHHINIVCAWPLNHFIYKIHLQQINDCWIFIVLAGTGYWQYCYQGTFHVLKWYGNLHYQFCSFGLTIGYLFDIEKIPCQLKNSNHRDAWIGFKRPLKWAAGLSLV